eukprot:515316_1
MSIMELILAIASITIHIVICVILLFFLWRFNRFIHCQALQKRQPTLVNCCVLVCVIYIGIGQSCFVLSLLFDGDNNPELNWKALHSQNSGKNIYYGNIFRLISMIIYAFTIHGVLVFFITRLWIIYFNLKWTIETKKNKWTIHINADKSSSFWFIRHRNDWGSIKRILTISLLYYLIQSTFLLILMLLSDVSQIIDIFFFLFEVSLVIVFRFKIHHFYDGFGIKEELTYSLKWGLLVLFLFILLIVGTMIFGNNKMVIVTIIVQTFLQIIWGIIGYYVVGYIFKKKYKYLLRSNSKK